MGLGGRVRLSFRLIGNGSDDIDRHLDIAGGSPLDESSYVSVPI